MLLNRRKIRTIKNTTDTTEETRTLNSKPLSFVLTTGDKFYLGFHDRFASRYFSFATANTNTTALTVKFWDGDAFVAVDDVIDQTFGFTESGFLSWVNDTKWQTKVQTGTEGELFWIEISVSADLSAGTSLEAVINIFSDDDLLRGYYPELVSDTRFQPPGRSDLLEQHVAGKNLVVQRMIQKKVIDKESQIIDINPVALAAVHATASIIMAPIAISEAQDKLLDDARSQFERELTQSIYEIDSNSDGVVSDAERRVTTGGLFRR